jgi:quercetin dioxygenase-like cupin family protein
VSGATVVAPGTGELVGDTPDRRLEILCEDDALHATLTRLGPGRDGADLHVHRRHHDLFYVLAGELTVFLGAAGDPVRVAAGTLVHVPPMVVHGFANRGGRELRYVNLHAPGTGFAAYLRGLRDGRAVAFDQEPPPGTGERPPSEAHIGAPPFDAGPVAVALVDIDGETPLDGPRALHVLDGEIAVASGAREHRASGGSWVWLPPGVNERLTGRARVLDIRVRSSAA